MKRLKYLILFFIFFMILSCISEVIGQFEETTQETEFDQDNPNDPAFWQQDNPNLSQITDWDAVFPESINALQDPEKQQEAIKKKYNAEVNLGGQKATISDDGTMTLADGSKIDLNTGKSLTVETDSSKVTYFDDGEGTTCLNCEGLTYTSEGFKVGSGEKVDYYGFRRA